MPLSFVRSTIWRSNGVVRNRELMFQQAHSFQRGDKMRKIKNFRFRIILISTLFVYFFPVRSSLQLATPPSPLFRDSCYSGYTCMNFYGDSGASICVGPGTTRQTTKCSAQTAIGACMNDTGTAAIETVYYQGGSCNATTCEKTCKAGKGRWSAHYSGL